jgi:hypothetical protein
MEGGPFVAVLPALGRVRLNMAKLDREIAALRCVEALRAYAAAHEGKLPKALDDVTEVPIPADPLTGKAFQYLSDGRTAVLSALAPSPDMPECSLRYELTLQQ